MYACKQRHTLIHCQSYTYTKTHANTPYTHHACTMHAHMHKHAREHTQSHTTWGSSVVVWDATKACISAALLRRRRSSSSSSSDELSPAYIGRWPVTYRVTFTFCMVSSPDKCKGWQVTSVTNRYSKSIQVRCIRTYACIRNVQMYKYSVLHPASYNQTSYKWIKPPDNIPAKDIKTKEAVNSLCTHWSSPMKTH